MCCQCGQCESTENIHEVILVWYRPNDPFFAGKSHYLVGVCINANDVIAFYRYLVNKLRRNFIKIKVGGGVLRCTVNVRSMAGR